MKTISINTIAKELKMDPKTARKKLRQAKNAPKSKSDTRWEFDPKTAQAVKKILAA